MGDSLAAPHGVLGFRPGLGVSAAPNFVPSAKETEGRLALAMLEVRGMAKGCETSSELKAAGSGSASPGGEAPSCSSAPPSSGTPEGKGGERQGSGVRL